MEPIQKTSPKWHETVNISNFDCRNVFLGVLKG